MANLHRRHLTNSGLCGLCDAQEDETPEHIFNSCTAYANARLDFRSREPAAGIGREGLSVFEMVWGTSKFERKIRAKPRAQRTQADQEIKNLVRQVL